MDYRDFQKIDLGIAASFRANRFSEEDDYGILEGTRPYELAGRVNLAIKEGWRPLGGIHTANSPTAQDPSRLVLYQALVRDKPQRTFLQRLFRN